MFFNRKRRPIFSAAKPSPWKAAIIRLSRVRQLFADLNDYVTELHGRLARNGPGVASVSVGGGQVATARKTGLEIGTRQLLGRYQPGKAQFSTARQTSKIFQHLHPSTLLTVPSGKRLLFYQHEDQDRQPDCQS
jgi:hypothetical protein